jgi:hypothetical protein
VADARPRHPRCRPNQHVSLNNAAIVRIVDGECAGGPNDRGHGGMTQFLRLVHKQHPLAARIRRQTGWHWDGECNRLRPIVEVNLRPHGGRPVMRPSSSLIANGGADRRVRAGVKVRGMCGRATSNTACHQSRAKNHHHPGRPLGDLVSSHAVHSAPVPFQLFPKRRHLHTDGATASVLKSAELERKTTNSSIMIRNCCFFSIGCRSGPVN